MSSKRESFVLGKWHSTVSLGATLDDVRLGSPADLRFDLECLASHLESHQDDRVARLAAYAQRELRSNRSAPGLTGSTHESSPSPSPQLDPHQVVFQEPGFAFTLWGYFLGKAASAPLTQAVRPLLGVADSDRSWMSRQFVVHPMFSSARDMDKDSVGIDRSSPLVFTMPGCGLPSHSSSSSRARLRAILSRQPGADHPLLEDHRLAVPASCLAATALVRSLMCGDPHANRLWVMEMCRSVDWSQTDTLGSNASIYAASAFERLVMREGVDSGALEVLLPDDPMWSSSVSGGLADLRSWIVPNAVGVTALSVLRRVQAKASSPVLDRVILRIVAQSRNDPLFHPDPLPDYAPLVLDSPQPSSRVWWGRVMPSASSVTPKTQALMHLAHVLHPIGGTEAFRAALDRCEAVGLDLATLSMRRPSQTGFGIQAQEQNLMAYLGSPGDDMVRSSGMSSPDGEEKMVDIKGWHQHLAKIMFDRIPGLDARMGQIKTVGQSTPAMRDDLFAEDGPDDVVPLHMELLLDALVGAGLEQATWRQGLIDRFGLPSADLRTGIAGDCFSAYLCRHMDNDESTQKRIVSMVREQGDWEGLLRTNKMGLSGVDYLLRSQGRMESMLKKYKFVPVGFGDVAPLEELRHWVATMAVRAGVYGAASPDPQSAGSRHALVSPAESGDPGNSLSRTGGVRPVNR